MASEVGLAFSSNVIRLHFGSLPRSEVDRITVSPPNEQNRLGSAEVHQGSEERRDPPKHAEGRTLPEPEEDDWRNIAITLKMPA